MKVKRLIVCGVLGLVLMSCSTKQSAISQLEDFSYELRDHSRYYDAEDWEKAGKKFVKIRERISKHEFDYTAEEKARIGKLEGQCASYMVKGAKDGFFHATDCARQRKCCAAWRCAGRFVSAD